MFSSSPSFKRTLGFASLAILTTLLSSPYASAMEVEAPKSLKRKDHPVEENGDPQKKQCLGAPLYVQYAKRKVFQELLEQANQGDEEAQDTLMKLYFHKLWMNDINPTTINFLEWNNIQKRCYLLNDYAYFVIEYSSYIGEHFPEIMKKTKERAKTGDTDAHYLMGYAYQNGFGVPENKNKAFSSYKAAKKKNMYAQYYLAKMYVDAEGCSSDNNQFLKYIRKSAELGFAWAQFRLADEYDEGQVVQQDKNQAIKYWTLAGEQGDADSHWMLAEHYKGVTPQPLSQLIGLTYKALSNQMCPMIDDQEAAKENLLKLINITKPADDQIIDENIDFDLEEFYAKTKVLTLDMGQLEARHMGGQFVDPNSPFVDNGLAPLYKKLADYGAILDSFAEIVKKNLKEPGFFITCVHPQDTRFLIPGAEYSWINCTGQQYSCIGGKNGQLGLEYNNNFSPNNFPNINHLKFILQIQLNTSQKIISCQKENNNEYKRASNDLINNQLDLDESVKTLLQNELDRRNGGPQFYSSLLDLTKDESNVDENTKNSLKDILNKWLSPTQKIFNQIEEELKLVNQAEQALSEAHVYFGNILLKTAPLRNKLFWEENQHFLQ